MRISLDTTMFEASKNGNINDVKLFLDTGIDINSKDTTGKTALYYACEFNQTAVAQYLLDSDADMTCCEFQNGLSPLIIATYKGNLGIVKALIERGVNVNVKSKEGKTSLWIAAANGCLPLTEELISANALLEASSCEVNISPLWIACKNGHYNVVKCLIDHGANVDTAKANGSSALFIASQKGCTEIVEFLLQQNADVNKERNDQCSPLHMAVFKGFSKIVSLLLKNRAGCNTKWKNDFTPLHIACIHGYKPIVTQLTESGADTNIRCAQDGATPLHLAAYYNHDDLVSILLKNGADSEVKSNDSGDTALTIGCYMNHIKTLKVLLSWNANINAIDNDGNTGLHMATQEGHSRIVKYLITNKAKEMSNNQGFKPCEIATQKGVEINKSLKELEKITNSTDTDLKGSFSGSDQVLDLLSNLKIDSGIMCENIIEDLLKDLSDKNLLQIAIKLDNNWKIFAGFLNISHSDITRIAFMCYNDHHVYAGWTMLEKWRDRNFFPLAVKKQQLKVTLLQMINNGFPLFDGSNQLKLDGFRFNTSTPEAVSDLGFNTFKPKTFPGFRVNTSKPETFPGFRFNTSKPETVSGLGFKKLEPEVASFSLIGSTEQLQGINSFGPMSSTKGRRPGRRTIRKIRK